VNARTHREWAGFRTGVLTSKLHGWCCCDLREPRPAKTIVQEYQAVSKMANGMLKAENPKKKRAGDDSASVSSGAAGTKKAK
jgi:hypothetical protein